MEYGICILNVIPLRQEPESTSAMVSQVLFGETFKITETLNDWFKIILDHDQYEGWISKIQTEVIDYETYAGLLSEKSAYSNELVNFLSDSNDALLPVTLGAHIPGLKNDHFYINKKKYHFEGDIKSGIKPKHELVKTAYLYLNAPYLWGGRTPFGIDCSGFTQMVYLINGHHLFRDAFQQASQGEVLSFIEESDAGDLAFFDDEEGNIVHSGIILNNNYIIHCHGKVRIDRLDQSGIFNEDTKRHTHNLRIIKKIF